MKFYPKKYEDSLAFRIALNYIEFLERCSDDSSICRVADGSNLFFPASIDRYLNRDNLVLSSHICEYEHQQ